MINVMIVSFNTSTYPVSIHNSMYGFQIFMNSDINEIVDFKDWLSASC